MNKKAAVAVVGGDTRQGILASLMHADGHAVSVGALERYSFDPDIQSIPELKTGLQDFGVVILPMPLGSLLDSIKPGTLVLAGAVPFAVHARAVRNHLRLTDYLTRDELAIRNAVPTAFAV